MFDSQHSKLKDSRVVVTGVGRPQGYTAVTSPRNSHVVGQHFFKEPTMAKRRPSVAAKQSRPKARSRKAKKPSKRSPVKTKKPRLRLVPEPDERAEAEAIFASGLPSHGYARCQARNAVFHHGVSLTRVSMVASKAMNTTIGAKKLAAALRKKGVPVIKIEYDDPRIYEMDAGNIELLKHSGLVGKLVDAFEIVKLFPELTSGATEDFFIPPDGIKVLEGIAAYSGLKRNREWNRFKKLHASRD